MKVQKKEKAHPVISVLLLIISGLLAFGSLIWLALAGKGKLLLVTAGAIAVIGFSLKETGYLRKNWETLRSALKRVRPNIILIILCDILLIASLVGLFFLVAGILESRAEMFTGGDDLMKAIETGDKQLAQETVSGLWNLLGLVITSWLLLIIVGILLYTFFKGLAWFMTFGVIPGWKDLYSFLFLNLFWLPAWTVGAIAVAVAVRAEVAAVIIVAYLGIFFHLTGIVNGTFVQKRNVKETLRAAFRIGFANFRYFLIPYLLLVLAVFIIVQASGLLRFISPEIMAAIMVIVVLPFIIAIGRIYLSEVIKELS